MTFKTNIQINVIAFLTVVVVAIAIIFFRFPSIPHNLSFDEVEFAKLALSLEGKQYTPYSELATGHSTLYFYIILASLKTFGLKSFALRFPSGLFGVLNAGLIFLLMKQAFFDQKKTIFKKTHIHSWLIPFILSILFVSLRWNFNFARFSFEATFLLFLELISILTFFTYKKNGSLFLLSISGIFAGLAFNSYTPGRLFFLLILFFLIVYILKKKILKTQIILIIVSYIIPFIIISLPLSLYFRSNPDIRLSQLSYINNQYLRGSEKLVLFGENVLKTSEMFFIKGDLNGRHNYPGKPALNSFIGLLFISGLILSTKNWRNNTNALFLTYFVLSLIPSLLTYPSENPHMLRTFTVLPAVVYFIGNTIFLILRTWTSKKILLLLFLLLVLSSTYELRTYFIYQTKVFPEAFEMKPDLKTNLNKQTETNLDYRHE